MGIEYSKDGHLAWITINRPHALNALDTEGFGDMRRYLIEARDDEDVRVILITGAGERAFCCGADIKVTLPSQGGFLENYFQPDEKSINQGLYIRGIDIKSLGIWKPIIAVINGYAVGGGFELAMACDLRIASENAKVGLPEVKIGSIPAVGGIQNLMRAIPSAIAMKMIFSGESVDAQTALKYGIVSDVVPPEKLRETAIYIAKTIANNAPLAIQTAKLLSHKGANLPLDQAVELEKFLWGLLKDTEDRIEGRKAFAEKRQPVYQGK
jgi:E-phenylitaconyl-CoA hydratase